MKLHKDSLSSFFTMLVAVLYATAMAMLPNAYFRDRVNYINYAIDSKGILNSYDNTLVLLFNEPLFLLLNGFLSSFIHADNVPAVFVFFISFTIFFVVIKKSKNMITTTVAVLLIFFTAQVFHLQVVVLRQGVATALFIWLVYYFWNTKKLYIFLPFLGFLHSSFFVVSLIFYIDKVTVLMISRRLVIRLFVQFSFGLVVALAGLYVASALGMRQASESHVLGPVSVGGGNFILWSLVLITLMSLSTKKLLSDPFYIVSMLGLCFYLALYFLSPIAGRVVGVFLPFCLVAITTNFSGRVSLIMFCVLAINVYVFFNGIEANSLTDSGVRYFSGLF